MTSKTPCLLEKLGAWMAEQSSVEAIPAILPSVVSVDFTIPPELSIKDYSNILALVFVLV